MFGRTRKQRALTTLKRDILEHLLRKMAYVVCWLALFKPHVPYRKGNSTALEYRYHRNFSKGVGHAIECETPTFRLV